MADKVSGSMLREAGSRGTVRITMPASVTYSPDALKESITSLAEWVGHPKCVSGANCLLQMERDFVYKVREKATPPTAVSLKTDQAVTVGLAPTVKYDIGKVTEAIDRVIDVIGAHPCISGFDLLLQNEMIIVNEGLEAQRFG